MKCCSRCHQNKPLENFGIQRGKPRAACQACLAVDGQQRYATKYRRPAAPYGHPCAECAAPIPPKKIGGAPRKYCTKECAVAANRKQRKADTRRYQLARYGLTQQQYDNMLASQGGVCAICLAEPVDRPLSVDHCHSTGVVRGLLCHGCNVGLGYYRDAPDLLRAAACYLDALAVVAA